MSKEKMTIPHSFMVGIVEFGIPPWSRMVKVLVSSPSGLSVRPNST